MAPEKRPDRAILLARALGVPLKIAAKIDRVDEAYFREMIEPLLVALASSSSGRSMSNRSGSFSVKRTRSCFTELTGRSRLALR